MAPYVWILSGVAAEMVYSIATLAFTPACVLCVQLAYQVSEGTALPQLPCLLGVYPTVSSTPQFDEFADVWKRYGSV